MSQLKERRNKINQEQEAALAGQGDLVKQKENCLKKIDRVYNKVEMIPKALKEAKKELETQSGGWKKEQELIRRMKFLEESVEHIKKKDMLEEKIRRQNQ